MLPTALDRSSPSGSRVEALLLTYHPGLALISLILAVSLGGTSGKQNRDESHTKSDW